MSGRGKGKARGTPGKRGRTRASITKAVDTAEEDVPELDDGPAPMSVVTPVRTSLRLNSLQSSQNDEIQEVTEIKMEPEKIVKDEVISTDIIDTYGVKETSEQQNGKVDVIEEIMKMETDSVKIKSENDDSLEINQSETAVVKFETADVKSETSEDEAEPANDKSVDDVEMVSEDELVDENKVPDTEAVSDEELQEPQGANLPETEAVSDDELPEEKRKRLEIAQAEAVSEDELPEEEKEKEKLDDGNPEDKSNDGKRKIADGEYDPCSPTSETSQDGAKKLAVADPKTGTPKPVKKVVPELEKYWKAVKDDPSDFTGWTYLLQFVDQENEVEVAREAYDAFLSHYPYCYGYWRKYADFEKRKGNIDACEAVFERGLKAIPLSVDLWLHYLNYCKVAHNDDLEYIRQQYNRSIDACGLEFRSDRLWDSYIKWEKEKKNLINITNLYDKLLAIPTQGYTTHFDNFQEHVSSNPPQTILPVDDFLEIRREVVASLKQYEKTTTAPTIADDAPPGEEPDLNKEDIAAVSTTSMEEETNALRERILSTRRKLHKTTVAAVAARWNFEEGIKRPYFHVKPLERCQLKNWKEYLDFEIEQGDLKRITILFERCLIACALYEEFWVRFIRYLEGKEDSATEKVRDVYERACLIHHKKKPNLHLQWAVFEEKRGNYDKAAEILASLDSSIPNLLQVAYRRINLERRQGNFQRAAELYEEYLASQTNKSVLTNMTVKYARFSWKMLNDIDKSISILEKALENDKDNTRLYLQLIDMGLQKNPVDEEKIVGILDRFLDKESDPEQKLMFAQRKIEFLEDFGKNIDKITKAQEDFQKLLKQVKEKKKKPESPEPSTPAPPPTSTHGPHKKDHILPAPVNVPPPNIQPKSGPPPNFPPQGYPPNYYGQYPPPTGAAQTGGEQSYPAGYPNYQNWNNYPPQGNYQNYGGQSGWHGYGYPNY